MSDNMSETPKTDKAKFKAYSKDGGANESFEVVDADVCAAIELQLLATQSRMSAALKSEQDCRQIITTYCEEIDGLNKLIAQKDGELRVLREAIMEARNALATIRSGPTACSGYINDMADASKWLDDALSTPSPSAVVPWEVVQEYLDANKQSPKNYGRWVEAIKALESYAPKGN